MDAWLGLKPKTAKPKPTQPAATQTAATQPAAAAKYRVKQRKDGRFNVVGPNGSITTRSTLEAAEAHIVELLSGHKPTPRQQPPAPSRSSSRIKPRPDKPTNGPGRKSGAAWHGKRKEPEAVDPADAVLDYLEANNAAKRSKIGVLAQNCAVAHKQLQSEHAELRIKYDKARALLAAELGYEVNEPLRRSETAELVGIGYDDLKGRTIRRHKHNVMAEIRLQVPIISSEFSSISSNITSVRWCRLVTMC